MAFDVIVSGHLCADLLPETSQVPLQAFSSPGKLYEIGALEISTGGAVSNTGLALERLGVRVGLMTSVGDDLMGKVIIARLKERDAALGDLITIRPHESSSYTVILSPENTDRILLHYPGNNARFGIEDINFDLVEQAKIFHLGYPPILPRMYANDGPELLAIYQRVHATRTITSLDMALPDPNTPGGQFEWKGLLKRLLPSVDVFLPSLEEIMYMLRREDYLRAEGRIMGRVTRATVRAIGEELLAMGLAVAGVKLGEYGFYLRTTADRKRLARLETLGIDVDAWTDVEIWQPTFDVKVVGTTGAGDSAYAGFLAALLRRLSPADAVRFACAVGASNTEAADASSGVRSWDETIRRVQSGWRESNLQLPES